MLQVFIAAVTRHPPAVGHQVRRVGVAPGRLTLAAQAPMVKSVDTADLKSATSRFFHIGRDWQVMR